MAVKLTKSHFYVVYHSLLLCFLLYLTVEINNVKPVDTLTRNNPQRAMKPERSNRQIFLEKLKRAMERGVDSQDTSQQDEDISDSAKREKRNALNFDVLKHGLFANFVNRTFVVRHDQWIEEVVPSLIALEDIVIREAQKTKLALQRVNVKIKELEQKFNDFSQQVNIKPAKTDDDYLTTLEPELLEANNITTFPNSTDEIEGSGEVESSPDYVTALPASYNGTQDYVFDMNNLLKPLYIIIEELEHKVSKQTAFAARTEVHLKNMQNSLYHLEDTINDEQRKLRQLATESSHHRSRMATIENLLNTIDGAEMRVNNKLSRLEDEQADFFDMLDEHSENFRDLRRSLYKATQTAKDLEGADTVHERDLRTLQQNIARLQQLLSRVYGTVDNSVMDLREEIKGDFSRLCFNNKQLIC